MILFATLPWFHGTLANDDAFFTELGNQKLIEQFTEARLWSYCFAGKNLGLVWLHVSVQV